ncbi:hypothetical protein IFM89_019272 [Coptis chinensis]|uniref:Pentatricopeptide repeat-containing protein n=1 Tax=Coptis chinensis TaxID=261450 RepID=A0A835H7F5_9MAGN|nr:hypothetical protein IFM89_019272 [Coptis chinensis]
MKCRKEILFLERYVIRVSCENGDVDEATEIFERMPNKNSIYRGTGYLRVFTKWEVAFNRMPERDEISWNTMISGYARMGKCWKHVNCSKGLPVEALLLGQTMVSGMDLARELFEAMPCQNASSWNTMITGYAQSGEINCARDLFNEMPKRDSISWSAIISGYAQSGHSEEALRLFIELKRDGERMNRSTFTCALSTCADMAALEFGKQVHGRLVKAGYEMGCYVGNALVLMYGKCGSVEEAYDVFESMQEKDLVTWNTMITCYAKHGFGKEALKVFDSMTMKDIKPDDVTMVGVLSACSHSGLIDKGTGYFHSMRQEYGITAKADINYTCMIDLPGRSYALEEAEALMRNMPFEPDAATWGALLGASRVHGNTKLAEEAAEKIFKMEPDNSGMYVLLSNLYADLGRWSDVGKMRVVMRDRGVKKVPGYSWIEVQNKVHTFSVGDSVHPEKDKIYAFLEDLDRRLKKEGYVSKTKMVLHDVEEEENEHML